MNSHRIRLYNNERGEFVDAMLHERIDIAYAQKVDQSWQDRYDAITAYAAANGKSLPILEHVHWEWQKKVSLSVHLLSCPTMAVECEGEAQGLMLLQTDGFFARNAEEKDKPLVYVTFLSSAPWNLPALVTKPKYKGVGTILLSTAIQTSMDLDFKGRIGLHSLPQSESYYECHNFECFGQDVDKQNLKYYEFSAKQAAEFLK